jgi:SAM-dependent methyltransferase
MRTVVPTEQAALEIWAERVRANREQVDQFREVEDGADFYAPIAARFRDDPHRTGEPALELLRSLVRTDETWLDVGAGGGRYTLPIALLAREVIALDQSAGMLAVLQDGIQQHGITNVRVIQSRWPAQDAPRAHVAFISNIGHDIEQIGAFVEALEKSARRMCVCLMLWRQPTAVFDDLWPDVHGVERATLPAMPDFITLLLARGKKLEVHLAERPTHSFDTLDQAQEFARKQTWVNPGRAKDVILRETLANRLTERDGRYAFYWAPSTVGLVTWQP